MQKSIQRYSNSIAIIVAILFMVHASAQTKTDAFYYPDGSKYLGKANTMKLISDELEQRGRVHVVYPKSNQKGALIAVGFKLFTDKPLWVLAYEPINPKDSIYQFDLVDFFKSDDFELALEMNIEKDLLSDIFILETLGSPDRKIKYFDTDIEFEKWTYESRVLELTFKKGIVISYIIQR